MTRSFSKLNPSSFILGFVVASVVGIVMIFVMSYNGSAAAQSSSANYTFVADQTGGVWICNVYSGTVAYHPK